MKDRLIPVSPALKAHRLWSGSMEETAFKYGGLTESHVRELVARLERCTDRTASEDSWLALWKKTLPVRES